jgi:serine/threonine protein kinase
MQHPNVVPMLGVYESDTPSMEVCIVSEWMPHGSVRQFLWSHPEANPVKYVSNRGYKRTIIKVYNVCRQEIFFSDDPWRYEICNVNAFSRGNRH